MANSKINYDDKIGIVPKTTRINQVWDDDMNEIKSVVNANDDKALYKGANVLDESTVIQVAPGFGFSVSDGLVTGIVIQENLLKLDGIIKILPDGVTPQPGDLLTFTNADGTIGVSTASSGLIDGVNNINANPFVLQRNITTPSDLIRITGNHSTNDQRIIIGDYGRTFVIDINQSTNKLILTNDAGNGVKLELDDTAYVLKATADYIDLLGSSVSSIDAAPGTALTPKDWVLAQLSGLGGSPNNVVFVPNSATVTQTDLTDNVTYVLQDFLQDTTINLSHNPAANKSLTATFYITGQDGWEYTFTDSTATIHDYLNGGLITSISFFAEEVYKIEVKTVNTGTQIIRYVTAGVAY